MMEIPLPARCPGCKGNWNQQGQCDRCGLLLSEALGLARAGCAAYERARRAAAEGRFAEAEDYLVQLRACGIPEVTEHPVAKRLAQIVALANGDAGTLLQVVASEERAARNAAARADFRAAAFYAERAATAAPGLLPLQKLRLLTLYGAGRMREAAEVREQLQRDVPADPDVLRWRFAELEERSSGFGVRGSGKSPAESRIPGPDPRILLAVGCAVGAAMGVWVTGRRRGVGQERTE